MKTILSGHLNAIVDGLSFRMESGDSILFFPFQFHASVDLEEEKHRFIAVSFILPNDSHKLLIPLKKRVFRLPPEDLLSLRSITEAFYGTGTTTHSQALLKLSEILLHQLELVRSKDTLIQSDKDYPQEDKCTAICNYIRENFTKKLSLKSLAFEFGVSPESISKLFRSHYPGITPGKLIGHLQIQAAAELLENSDLSISEIAQKCGFTDPFIFSKKFKRIIGVSPRIHRLQISKRNL